MSKRYNNKIKKFYHHSFKNFLLKAFHHISPNTTYLDNWHIDLICDQLDNISQGQLKRLLVNIPPRSLKSTIISVAWPAYLLGCDPTLKIVVASYSQKLSVKHSEECRLIMLSDWYMEMFEETRIRKGSNTKHKYVTTQSGFRFATSIGGTLTGEGADILIMDDPHTPANAASVKERDKTICWFDQTFVSRLNNKNHGAIVVVMQRLHSKDLSAHLIKKKSWKHLNLKAIADIDEQYEVTCRKIGRKAGDALFPKREGKELLTKLAHEMGSYVFSAQYQQAPNIADGSLIRLEWIKYHEEEVEYDMIVHSWDCASKTGEQNDFSVCTIWGVCGASYHILDIVKKRLEFPELKNLALALLERDNPAVILIEDKSAGQALIQELKEKSAAAVYPISPTASKLNRLFSSIPFFENGEIYLKRALWNSDYVNEITSFPNCDHDDQLDSTTQFLNWIRTNKATTRLRRV